jgi:glutathione S-transferase
MARYKLHCVGASGNSYKLALYMNCAGIDVPTPLEQE